MPTRTCRACGATYEYPARGSFATRVHCDECAALDLRTRRALERLNQRLSRLVAEVEKLKGR